MSVLGSPLSASAVYIRQSVFLSFNLRQSASACLSVCLTSQFNSMLFLSLQILLVSFCLSHFLFVSLSVCLLLYVSVRFVCLSISVCLSCLSGELNFVSFPQVGLVTGTQRRHWRGGTYSSLSLETISSDASSTGGGQNGREGSAKEKGDNRRQ